MDFVLSQTLDAVRKTGAGSLRWTQMGATIEGIGSLAVFRQCTIPSWRGWELAMGSRFNGWRFYGRAATDQTDLLEYLHTFFWA